MSDIISQLVSQLGISSGQAESGAGAIMGLIKDKAASGDFKELLNVLPEANGWMDKAAALTGGGDGGGGLLGAASGLLGGGGNAAGLASVVSMLSKSGMSADSAAKFLPALLPLIQAKLGDGLFGKLLSAVPMLQGAMGSGGGAGGAASLLGGLAKGLFGNK